MATINSDCVSKPLVCVRCTTYNQQEYIRYTLDGFISQRTDFPFVVVVHDDASTDATADIIREYVSKYPHLFIPILQTENQYSKHNGKFRQQIDEAIKATGAKYIAMCEGDDYWSDPLKLQKQINIFEQDPDVSLVYSGFNLIDSKNNIIHEDFYDNIQKSAVSGYILPQLFIGNFIMTVSTCYRADVLLDNPFITTSPIPLDYLYILAGALKGKCVYIPEKLVAYRRNPNGMMLTQFRNVVNRGRRVFLHAANWYLSHENIYPSKEYQYAIRSSITRRLISCIRQTDDKEIRQVASSIIRSTSILYPYIPKAIYNIAKDLIIRHSQAANS